MAKTLRINSGNVKNMIEMTECMKMFMRNVLSYEPIEKETENELFREYIVTKDESIRNKIICSNARFAFSAAKSFTNDPYDVLDLFMEGMEGIIDAFDRFDPTTGNHFLSFATHYIYKYIVEYVHKNGKVIKRSKDLYLRGKSIKIKDKFFAENGRYPTPDEIIKIIEQKYGIKVNKKEHIEDISIARLDSTYKNNDEDSVALIDSSDFTKNDGAYTNNEYLYKMESEDNELKVNTLLNVISERDREIIKKLFGIGVDFPMSPEDVAEEYGMTTSRVNQIRKEGIEKMKKAKYLIAV